MHPGTRQGSERTRSACSPKLRAYRRARRSGLRWRSGVRRCHLISYQENGALLQELFSRDGIGTQIVMESAEQIRRATIMISAVFLS